MSSRPTSECPRCGYDLGGVPPTWSDQCPVTGVCSECALVFAWVDVFKPWHNQVRGFVEHARGWREVLKSAWITWLWTIWPPLFHKRVRLESASNARLRARWLVLILASLYVVSSALGTFMAPEFGGYRPNAIGAPEFWKSALAWTWPIDSLLERSSATGYDPAMFLLEWSTPLVIGLTLNWSFVILVFILSTPFSRAKIATRHVWRAGVYGCAWLAIPLLFRSGRNLIFQAEAAIGGYTSVPAIVDFNELRPMVLIPILLGTYAWILLWWMVTIWQGWRVRRPLYTFGVLCVVAVLAAPVSVIVLHGIAVVVFKR